MTKLCGAGRHIQNESPVTEFDITRQLPADTAVTADQVRTVGLILLKRHQPVRFAVSGLCRDRGGLPGQLPVPDGVRDLARKLARQLALAILRELRMRQRPGFARPLAAEHADAHAAAMPAGEEPEIKIPGCNSAGTGGNSFSLSVR